MFWLYIALGGGLGAMMRYGITVFMKHLFGAAFPYGTMTVNILGSFMMGMVIAYLVKALPHSMELRSFLATGILGGFTTFSAFSLDTITLYERGDIGMMSIYVIGSVVLSIFAVFAGLMVVRNVL